jgi:hypothetical protein
LGGYFETGGRCYTGGLLGINAHIGIFLFLLWREM